MTILNYILFSESAVTENERLKSVYLCMVCKTNIINALFVPCKHHKLCMECANNFTHCPVCGGIISQTMKTFMS